MSPHTRFNILKNNDDRAIAYVVLATGISSVVTQLLTIRELLTQFEGNEIIIALILFGWLILGGIGTLAAHTVSRGRWKVTRKRLGWLSLCLTAVAPLQIIAIRLFRDSFFIHGTSVGFYPTLGYIFCLITPYCLMLGFVLPYSLFVLRAQAPEYPGARIYILDNLGDISGGALFSFALVFLFSPLQAVFLAHLPLVVASMILFPAGQRLRPGPMLATGLALALLAGGMFIEKTSLEPVEGDLVDYRESLYGRITVHRDREQLTIFEDGIPLFSSQNLIMAEESIHYPLAQVNNPKDILLISAEGGIMEELAKYAPRTIDYVELNPEVTRVLFGFGLIEKITGLEVIHRDGRAYLADTDKIYDAIIVNLPEPDT
jgi:spermidine synthase